MVLGPGVPFNAWRGGLQARLSILNVVGNVFHDIRGIKPLHMPMEPACENDGSEDSKSAWEKYESDLEKWAHGEFRAKDAIISRLSPDLIPEDYDVLTSKELYESLAATRTTTASVPHEKALRLLLTCKLTIAVDNYCDTFLKLLQGVNNGATLIANGRNNEIVAGDYKIPKGIVAALFVFGTEGVDLLNIWRGTKTRTSDGNFLPLEQLMSTLRTESGSHQRPTSLALAAANLHDENSSRQSRNPDDVCRLCRHYHLNRHCFKQHPELAIGPKGKKWLEKGRELEKKNGRGKAAKEADSESDEDVVGTRVSAVALFNDTPYIYDTGASHHFMCHKSVFQSLEKRPKPFKFNQAVGAMVLTKQGTARIRFGNLELDLHDALYSPTSSCNIISAAR